MMIGTSWMDGNHGGEKRRHARCGASLMQREGSDANGDDGKLNN